MDDDTVQLKAVICAAEEAFCKRDFDLAYEQFKKFADMGYPFPMFRCALILEYGWSRSGVDADRAHEYYKAMVSYFDDCHNRIDEDDDLKEEGFLGCARYILIKKDRESKEKALYYCSKAYKTDFLRCAYLTSGRVYEELFCPPNYAIAAEFYKKAARAGSIYGILKYASALWWGGHKIRSIVVYAIFPFWRARCIIRLGWSALRKE